MITLFVLISCQTIPEAAEKMLNVAREEKQQKAVEETQAEVKKPEVKTPEVEQPPQVEAKSEEENEAAADEPE